MDGPENKLASGLVWVSLACVGALTLGMVLTFIWVMRRREGELPPASDSLFLPALTSESLASPAPRASRMQTLNLRVYTANAPSLVVEAAPDRAEVAEISVVGPAGTYATLSYDVAALYNQGANPMGRVFTLAAGAYPKRFKLKPGQRLYGVGSIDDVTLSVSIG